ncbi:MAG: GNAT family protein [Planctomycetota bacterium]
MHAGLRFLQIEPDSPLPLDLPGPTDLLAMVWQGTQELYAKVGFVAPFGCYLCLENGVVVGTCGFKAPPADGSVEIAYFSFPGHEGRGLATAMADFLVRTCRGADPDLAIRAQTLPDNGASHRVLEKLAFERGDDVQHVEDGLVWEWHL